MRKPQSLNSGFHVGPKYQHFPPWEITIVSLRHKAWLQYSRTWDLINIFYDVQLQLFHCSTKPELVSRLFLALANQNNHTPWQILHFSLKFWHQTLEGINIVSHHGNLKQLYAFSKYILHFYLHVASSPT